MPSLEFLGVGAATDFEQGETSVLYRGTATILVDCGPQIPSLLVRSLAEPDALDVVYVTHRHGDHCFGLGAWLLWLRTSGRKRSLCLCAEASTLDWLAQLLSIGYPDTFAPSKCFPLEWVAMNEGERHERGGVILQIAPTHHNVLNHALRVDDGESKVAFSGDGLPIAQTMELYAGCNVVVQECGYAEGEHSHHATVQKVAEMLEAAKPRRAFLTHCLTGQRASIDSMAKERFGSRVTVPRRGDRVVLDSFEPAESRQ